jgi:hypothetical protein
MTNLCQGIAGLPSSSEMPAISCPIESREAFRGVAKRGRHSAPRTERGKEVIKCMGLTIYGSGAREERF